MPQTSKNKYFLVVLDYFSYKNWSNDLVRGLFSSLDIGTYILSPCGPLCTFMGPFGGAQMPQYSIKNHFLIVLDYFPYKNGPNDLVRGLFLSLDNGTYIPPTCRSLFTIFDPFGAAQMPQKSIKKLYSGCFGLFLLQEWA
jgi:hypothetical protein